MSTYYIEMGAISGEYTAETQQAALDLFAQDAGYASWKAACDQELASDDSTIVVEVDVDALVAACPAAVFSDSYGNGVAVADGVSYSSYHELAQSFGRNVWDFRA